MERERGCSQSTGTGVPGPPPNQSKTEKQMEPSGEPELLPADHFMSAASRPWVLGPCRFGGILALEIPGGERGLAAGHFSWPGFCKKSPGSSGGRKPPRRPGGLAALWGDVRRGSARPALPAHLSPRPLCFWEGACACLRRAGPRGGCMQILTSVGLAKLKRGRRAAGSSRRGALAPPRLAGLGPRGQSLRLIVSLFSPFLRQLKSRVAIHGPYGFVQLSVSSCQALFPSPPPF